MNIDEEKIEAAITERTKAIVVVHYAGISCEMTGLWILQGREGYPLSRMRRRA